MIDWQVYVCRPILIFWKYLKLGSGVVWSNTSMRDLSSAQCTFDAGRDWCTTVGGLEGWGSISWNYWVRCLIRWVFSLLQTDMKPWNFSNNILYSSFTVNQILCKITTSHTSIPVEKGEISVKQWSWWNRSMTKVIIMIISNYDQHGARTGMPLPVYKPLSKCLFLIWWCMCTYHMLEGYNVELAWPLISLCHVQYIYVMRPSHNVYTLGLTAPWWYSMFLPFCIQDMCIALTFRSCFFRDDPWFYRSHT